MKKTITYLASAGMLSLSMIAAGCGETEGVKQEIQATAPDGSTTNVTKEVKVETSGDNPPAVAPVEKPATP